VVSPPYLFEGKVGGVDVELACGFYTPFSEDSDDEATAFKIDEAGWTVICNDRVVLHKDKTILTGWGDGTPNYHPQFRADRRRSDFFIEGPQTPSVDHNQERNRSQFRSLSSSPTEDERWVEEVHRLYQ